MKLIDKLINFIKRLVNDKVICPNCNTVNKLPPGYNYLYCSNCNKKILDNRNQF